MKKTFLLLFAAFATLVTNAHGFEVGGIYYNITSEADKQAEVTSSDGTEYSGSITIPATVTHNGVNYSVTSIGEYAFYDCSSLKSITIPKSVTSIESGVFYNCSSLTSINIPESVTSIGDDAFYGCSGLTAIIVEEGNEVYDSRNGCNAIIETNSNTLIQGCSTTIIPEGVTSIGDYAFSSCSRLTDITLPEGVTSIGVSAFAGCSSLTAINIPEGVTSIGGGAFCDCSRFTSITIPEDSKLTSIGERAFYGCSRLTSITIPENSQLTSIGESAFSGCSGLATITIPKGVTSIGSYTFSRCSGLERVIINCANVGDWFRGLSSLKEIVLGEGVTSIGDWAFAGCLSLTAITIPEGVTSIGISAFNGCSSLKELTLGKELKKIASGAFAGCTALEKVTIYATRPPSIEGTGNAFFSDATYENATLYVPQGCIDNYQVMTGWSGFYTIEEMEGGTPNYLTLRQADNGEVGIVVDLGRTYKVRITAFEGWKIHSVTFNDEDVTAQLTEEGTFTTPALQADAVLNIAYEKIETTTTVASAQASRIKVQGHQGILRITGTTEGDDISVYTTDGMLVAQESAEDGETLLTLPIGQVYIVTVADMVVKIGM